MATKKTTSTTKTAKMTTAKKPAAMKTADKKMSQIDAALAVLKKARKPMSCREMVEAMAKQKLWTSPGGKTPDATLYAAILRDLRKHRHALQEGSVRPVHDEIGRRLMLAEWRARSGLGNESRTFRTHGFVHYRLRSR
ncbi:winged helix-turn-helix domain-containing protein [Roseiconus lacunae]|uniref:winged helix-turn-helix domain-containing protein n=1 Tax=Roseiconus lacunae TaxID=2605694 RepID=UPI00308CC15D|nr:winged helix-turn-helix domain-containing protein [Stieleria sp. HD01]